MKKRSYETMNRLTAEEFRRSEKVPVWVVLDNIRSQHNIGSVFRTCDAFRMEGISLCGITAVPPHREIRKSALGAEEAVTWDYYEDTAGALYRLREQGYVLVAVEQAEEAIPPSPYTFVPGNRYALIFGNEVNGISDPVLGMADFCIEIPQAGTKHSLNIAVSAGIILWEAFRQLGVDYGAASPENTAGPPVRS